VHALIEAARETGAAVIVVTHDRELAANLPRTVAIRDGRIDVPAAVGSAGAGRAGA
jgi:putative ABC transport system ATP-binding protein